MLAAVVGATVVLAVTVVLDVTSVAALSVELTASVAALDVPVSKVGVVLEASLTVAVAEVAVA
jgi:hypothetical protein